MFSYERGRLLVSSTMFTLFLLPICFALSEEHGGSWSRGKRKGEVFISSSDDAGFEIATRLYWVSEDFSRSDFRSAFPVDTLGICPEAWQRRVYLTCIFNGHKESSDTNTGPPMWQNVGCPLCKGPWLRGGTWDPVQALLTKWFALVWSGTSREKGRSFSNWVSSSPFQTLGGSLLCGLLSRVCLHLLYSSQSAFVLTNMYRAPTLCQAMGLQQWTDRHASCFHVAYSLLEDIPSFFLHGNWRAFCRGAWAELCPCSLRHLTWKAPVGVGKYRHP